MNILFIGDLVGKAGRRVLTRYLPELMDESDADLVIVNAENAAGGFGMSLQIYEQLTGLGVDVITTGNHVWDRREFVQEISDCERLLRPYNYPPGVPGRGLIVVETDRGPAAVINLAGRVYMTPADDPFRAADAALAELDSDIKVKFVDFHAEATSEKQALGFYLDGRVTAVVGTHTHVPTADERVLPKGTAYLSDAGMCGPQNSVIGVKVEACLERFLTGIPQRFETAAGPLELNGAVITCDDQTGRALSIRRVRRELNPD